VCLIARHLEANGIPTLCLGSAFDILSAGSPPRAMFVDYPLGHSAGKPFDRADQEYIVRSALNGFNSLKKSGQIGIIDSDWGSADWKNDASATAGEDTRQPRDTRPQYQFEEDRIAAEKI
jgi:hypothetical protein